MGSMCDLRTAHYYWHGKRYMMGFLAIDPHDGPIFCCQCNNKKDWFCPKENKKTIDKKNAITFFLAIKKNAITTREEWRVIF